MKSEGEDSISQPKEREKTKRKTKKRYAKNEDI